MKCKNCKYKLLDTDKSCPNCGEANDEYKDLQNVPTNIKEFSKWYLNQGLPSEDITKYYIFKCRKEPNATGIYYDFDKKLYYVYKNSDSGEQKIIYEGKDEKDAVNVIYQDINKHLTALKLLKSNIKSSNEDSFPFCTKLFLIHFLSVFVAATVFNIDDEAFIIPYLFLFFSVNPGIFIMLPIVSRIKDKNKAIRVEKIWHYSSLIIFGILVIGILCKPFISRLDDAYYKYENIVYYQFGEKWYYFDTDSESWSTCGKADVDSFEYLGKKYDKKYHVTDFKDSDYYDENTYFDFE